MYRKGPKGVSACGETSDELQELDSDGIWEGNSVLVFIGSCCVYEQWKAHAQGGLPSWATLRLVH